MYKVDPLIMALTRYDSYECSSHLWYSALNMLEKLLTHFHFAIHLTLEACSSICKVRSGYGKLLRTIPGLARSPQCKYMKHAFGFKKPLKKRSSNK